MFIAFTVVAVTIGGVILFLRRIEQTVLDAYRVWGTGDMLVEYMKANNGQWPKDWNDVRQFMTNQPGRYMGITGFDDVHAHMDIDFTFDPTTVDTAIEFDESDAAFRATWLRNGKSTRWEECGANEIIFRYLRSQALAGSVAASSGSEDSQVQGPEVGADSNGVPSLPAQ